MQRGSFRRELRPEHQPDLRPQGHTQRDRSVLPDGPLAAFDQNDGRVAPAPLMRSRARRQADTLWTTAVLMRCGRCRAAARRPRYVSVASAWRKGGVVDDRCTVKRAGMLATQRLRGG